LGEFLAKGPSAKRLAILFSIAQTLDLSEQSERFSLKEVKERIAQEILRALPKEEKLTLELLYYLLSPSWVCGKKFGFFVFFSKP